MDIYFASFEGMCHLIIHEIFKHKPIHEYKHARESVKKISDRHDLKLSPILKISWATFLCRHIFQYGSVSGCSLKMSIAS